MRATRHLELAIDIDSDPITGSFSRGAENSRPFTGWIELVAAIEAARSSEHPAGGPGNGNGKTLGSTPGANGSEL
ncbi:MAG: hypothetical protein JO130_13195 [Solirubrobacterales bacterium]|nr:hypothetical protein [Solirubrobacterales bacterium]